MLAVEGCGGRKVGGTQKVTGNDQRLVQKNYGGETAGQEVFDVGRRDWQSTNEGGKRRESQYAEEMVFMQDKT
jgi:hypothetical protein